MKFSTIHLVFICIALLGTYAAADINDNLVAYYPFDGTGNDVSGHGNHSITHNVDIVEGITGQAYYFSGTGNWHGAGESSYIEIDGSGTYNDYTVSMWVKAAEAAHSPFFSDAHTAGSQSHGRPDIGIYSGRFYILGSGSGSGKAASLSTGYDDNQWHHVVGMVNATTDMVQLYVDGQFQSQVSHIPAYPLILDNGGSADYRIDIGARTRKNKYFKGAIDDVRIYDRALSSEEIMQLYNISEPLDVYVDIKPGSCPNPINVKSKGVLPVAILGSEEFDASTIDPASVRLNDVEPIRSSLEDVAAPLTDPNECECTANDLDGYIDLTLKFSTQDIVESLGEVNTDDILTLPLTGVLYDGIPMEGEDFIIIVGRHKPINIADVNEDGVVNVLDITIYAQNWLESSIVDD